MASTVASSTMEKVEGQIEQVEAVQAIEHADENDMPLWRLIAQSPMLLVYAFLANCGSLLFGYDVLVGGAVTALPAFSISFGSLYNGNLILPALWQGLWQAMNALGIMVGAAGNGFLQDKFGRRPMFSVGGIVAAIGTALAYIASDLSTPDARSGMLVGAKFIIGIGMGICMSTCATYVSEISPPRLRTVLLGFYAFMICVGQMIAISVVFGNIAIINDSAFKIAFASCWAFSGFAIVSSFLIPESPMFYASKGFDDKALASLRRLHGSKKDVAPLLQAIKATFEHEKHTSEQNDSKQASYAECFRSNDLRRTKIVALLHTLQQFIGVSLVANSTYFFISAGMSPTESLTVNQIGVGLSMAGTLVAWWIMSNFGSRATILGGFVVAGCFFTGMGIAGFFESNKTALRFLGVSLILAALTSNLSVGTAYPIVASEISSIRLRAKTNGLGFFWNAFTTFIFSYTVPYMFNADQGNLSGKIGFVFLGTCIIGFILSWLMIPETKGIPYATLDYMFKTAVPTRQFKKRAVEIAEADAAEVAASG